MDVPGFLLVLTLWGYWVGVGVMVDRIRRKKGRSAGAVPLLWSERLLWTVWVPAVLAWLVVAAVHVFRGPEESAFEKAFAGWTLSALRWSGAVGACLSFLATALCWVRLGTNWGMAVVPGQKTDLVTVGPYALVRHPIYALSILMMLCSLAVVPTVPMVLVAIIHVTLLLLKARSEERFLLDAHGPKYAEYAARTGRFLPRFFRGRGRGGASGPALHSSASGPRCTGGGGPSGRLGLFQEMMALWEEFHPYNAAHVLRLQGRAEPDRLREAIENATVVSGVGAITVDADGRSYRYGPAGAAEVREAVRCVTADGEEALQAVASALTAELNRPFEEGRHPVRWIVLDDPATATHFLVAAYRHIAADSVAMRLLIRRVLNRHLGFPVEGDEEALDVTPPEAASLFKRHARRLGLPRTLVRSGRLYFELRRVHRFREREDAGDAETCRLFKTREGFVERLAAACKARGVTVHDACAAALISALGEMTPLRSAHERRRGLAVATIVDLRGEAEVDLSKAFGLYLGQSVIVVREPGRLDFDELLRRTSSEMRVEKEEKRFAGPQWSHWLIARLRDWLPYENSRAWYRKVYPLSGGLSSVRLDASWFGEGGARIAEYFRVAPCGPAVPLVLAPTTFDGELNFSLTWRDSTWTAEGAEKLMGLLMARLEGLV